MKEFTLYCSGIPYGRFYLDGDTIFHEQLDIKTATFLPKRAVTTADNQAYLELSNMNILQFFERLHIYEAALSSKEDEIIMPTKDKERYQKAENHLYVQRDVKYPLNLLVEGHQIKGVLTPAREIISLLVENGYETHTILSSWMQMYPSNVLHPVHYFGCFKVTTSDHIGLATDVFLPGDRKDEKLSTVLVRTPYGKEEYRTMCYRFVQRGYAVVIQDVRGRHGSEGSFIPEHYEIEDGDATLSWIADQPWSNKKIGMTGGSYLGYVQWAAAASKNPYLKAITSFVCAGSAFMDLPRSGGCFSSGTMAWAFAMSEKITNMDLMKQENWEELLDIRPLEDIPKVALGHDIPFLNEWLAHKDEDAFWKASNWAIKGQRCEVPALIVSGWFDDDGMGTTEALELTMEYPKGKRKVILGPWQHSGNSSYDIHGFPLGNNALRFDIDWITFAWLEHFLNDVDNGIDQGASIEYYTMGENKWKEAEAWPVSSTSLACFYLDSEVSARTCAGDGCLISTMPLKQGLDYYLYDPKHPATHIIDMAENEIQVPENYTEEEKRSDYLVYSTPPLSEPITITGDMLVELYISSSAVDTDFIVRICDVDEEGTSYKLADGHISARYRNSYQKAEFMKSDQVYKIDILTSKISMCFAKGHRIRLTITSSAKNCIFPNSNTVDGYNSTTTVIAQNIIHHGPHTPSKLIFHLER